MSDYNRYDKSNNKRNITRHFLSDSRALDLSLVTLILATAGAFLQIGGTSWDVTSHLLQLPETFFTPSHMVLYLGVGLLTIAAGIGGILLLRKRELRKKSFAIAFKLFVIGSAIALVAGPSDFLWHQTFGIDGLLSPTHLILATAMLINSVAVVLGLNRITEYLPSSARKIKLVMIPALSALWLTATWYVYLFALPLSQGQHFNFNLHPILQLAIATIVLPLIGSIIFLTTSRIIGRFGAATAVTAVLIGMNVFANIIPSNALMPFLPWYVLIILPAMAADVVLNKKIFSFNKNEDYKGNSIIASEKRLLAAGAIIASLFYVIGYPMLPITFSEFLGLPFNSMKDLLTNFEDTLPLVFAGTFIPAVFLGITGAIISLKKIKEPRQEKEHEQHNPSKTVER
jgi:hypothetical protein